MIGLGMNPFITAQGFGGVGMMTVGLGALVNIVLDPIFIFGLGMGVRGAALATVIAQGCSALWVLRFLTGRRAILRLRVRTMALCAPRVRSIVTLGLSLIHIYPEETSVCAPARSAENGERLQCCEGEGWAGPVYPEERRRSHHCQWRHACRT